MSNRTIQLTEELHQYLLAVSLREPALLHQLRQETAQLAEHEMQIAPEQGQFMQLLVKLSGARRILEIGTFTGYSSLSMALALPADGQIVACDVSEPYTAVARRYWREAGVAEQIDLRLAPATETLPQLLSDGQANQFDMAFIDADKPNYDHYYEWCLQLVKPSGLILIDNIFRDGQVLEVPEQQDEGTLAIHTLNHKLHTDERVDISLVPLGDGLMLLRKR